MRRYRHILLGASVVLMILSFFALITRERERGTRELLVISPAPQTTLRPTNAATAPSAPTQRQTTGATGRARTIEAVRLTYSAPIAFYGRAQDQHGQAVSGAKVQYSALDRFWEPGTKQSGITDSNGNFSIIGLQGAALSVQVSKEGYDRIYNQSDGAFSYGVPYDPQRDRPTPTKENPTVFVLRKKAPADPLFTIDRDVPIPKDGTPVGVSLRTGQPVEAANEDVKLECWTSDQAKDADGHYEWRFRVSVPGGGLVKRNDTELTFDAPDRGYEPSIEVRMLAAAVRWQRDHDDQYWLQLRDGTYARMRLRMTTGGGHFASITSYLNPSGSRNLEFDPNKRASAR